MPVISGRSANASASAVNPAKRNHAGVWTRISQSAASIMRRSSRSGWRVFTILGISGRSRRSRSASVGKASFHDRRKVEITGHAHSGASLHFSPATKATASITQNAESGLWAPALSERRCTFFQRAASSVAISGLPSWTFRGIGAITWWRFLFGRFCRRRRSRFFSCGQALGIRARVFPILRRELGGDLLAIDLGPGQDAIACFCIVGKRADGDRKNHQGQALGPRPLGDLAPGGVAQHVAGSIEQRFPRRDIESGSDILEAGRQVLHDPIHPSI